MYNGIGLNTPRGSGTSGYIQKNLSTVRRPKRKHEKDDQERDIQRLEASLARPPNEDILEHRRKREIAVKCLEKREKLEDEGFTEEEIETELAKYREELMEKAAKAADIKEHKIHLDRLGRPNVLVSSVHSQGRRKKRRRRRNNNSHRDAPGHQDTHSMAAMSQSRNERLKSALGISADFKEGTSHQLLDSSRREKDQANDDEPKEDEQPAPAASPVKDSPVVVESRVAPEPVAEKPDAPKVYKMLDDSDSEEESLAKKGSRERKELSSSPENVPKRYKISSDSSKNRRRRSPSSASSASGSSDSNSSASVSPPRHVSSRRRDESRSSRSPSRSRNKSRSRSHSRSPSRRRSNSRRRSRDRHHRSRDDRRHGSSHHRSSRRSDHSSSKSRKRSHSRSRSRSRDRSFSRRSSSYYKDSRRN